MTAGDRSQNYQLGFTEPFLFDRNITGGFDIYKRSLQYIGYYTQKSTGGNLVFGVPVRNFSRMFFNYSYETTRSAISTRRSSTSRACCGRRDARSSRRSAIWAR
jgi:outer membrane protein assembly factor BamA